MAIDRERQRTIQEAVAYVRAHLDNAGPTYEDEAKPDNLAEILAILVAQARHDGADEALAVEIVLRSVNSKRDTLREARQVMAALGYDKIEPVLKRLERSAPRRLTFLERMNAKTGY
jgi:hypothetical protein